LGGLGKLRNRVIIGILLGVVVVAGLAIYADFNEMVAVLRDFEWALLVPILLFTLFNYALRFFKWDVYLRLIGATGVPKMDSLLIFLSGLAMAMTPGKVGEVLKSYLLKQVRGTPISVSAPIVMAERLTDGIAMLVLATVGLIMFNYGTPLLITIAAVVVVFLLIFQNRKVMGKLLNLGERLPFVSRGIHHFHAFYESSYELFRLPNLTFGVGIGVVSWSGEVIALLLVLLGLHIPFSWTLLVISAFVLSASTLIGSVTLLPGGLGTTDASITGMLIFLVPLSGTGVAISHSTAVAATLIIRFATLWFGVGIGLVALMLMQRQLGKLALPEDRASLEAGTTADIETAPGR